MSSDCLLVDVVWKFENWRNKCILSPLFKILTREEFLNCDLKHEVMDLVDFSDKEACFKYALQKDN